MLFSLDELIAIKLYTDCDKQDVFRRTFWSGTRPKQRGFLHLNAHKSDLLWCSTNVSMYTMDYPIYSQ